MIEVGKNANRYFDRDTTRGEKRYELKPLDKYAKEQGKSEQPSKRYFSAKTLPDLINTYPIMRKTQMSNKEIEKEKFNRLAFIDFLQGLLNLNPIERWSPQQAKQHPFITGEAFTCPFQPPFISRKQHHVIPTSPNQQQQKTSPPSGYRKIPQQPQPQPTYSDSYLSPTYSSLPKHYENNKRSSYIPPLPSVLEPPHNDQHQHQLNSMYQGQAQTMNNSRPRANTVGTMQVPPQIQWATVDHSDGTAATEGSLYSPYYPYGQQEDQAGLLPRWTNNRQTVDLERDGDWQENKPSNHKRSNSSVRFSEIPTASVSSSMINNNSRSSVASFHRLMRGHTIPYTRQDIEWDGVHQTPPLQQQQENEFDDKGWMIA